MMPSSYEDSDELGFQMKNVMGVTTRPMFTKWLTQLGMYTLFLFVYGGTTIGSQCIINVVDTLEYECETFESLEATKTSRASTRNWRCHSSHDNTIIERRLKSEFRCPKPFWFSCNRFAAYEPICFISSPRAPPALS